MKIEKGSFYLAPNTINALILDGSIVKYDNEVGQYLTQSRDEKIVFASGKKF